MATVTNVYFNSRMDSATMKTKYRELVRKYHPDLNPGIDDSTIKAINNEYSYWYARAASSEVYEKKTQENPDKDYTKYTSAVYIESLQDMINELLNKNIDRAQGIEIELIGVFIWISGIGIEHATERAIVKGLGFNGGYKYHDDGTRVYMWKWTPELKRFASNPNIDSIRGTYGSYSVKRQTKRIG